jgi:hypothetical protein
MVPQTCAALVRLVLTGADRDQPVSGRGAGRARGPGIFSILEPIEFKAVYRDVLLQQDDRPEAARDHDAIDDLTEATGNYPERFCRRRSTPAHGSASCAISRGATRGRDDSGGSRARSEGLADPRPRPSALVVHVGRQRVAADQGPGLRRPSRGVKTTQRYVHHRTKAQRRLMRTVMERSSGATRTGVRAASLTHQPGLGGSGL